RARRRKSLGSPWRTGEAGCSSTTVKTQAETMKSASSDASIKYSGQWLRSASHMTATRLNSFALIDVVSDASRSAISRDRIRPQPESDTQSAAKACSGRFSIDAGNPVTFRLLAYPKNWGVAPPRFFVSRGSQRPSGAIAFSLASNQNEHPDWTDNGEPGRSQPPIAAGHGPCRGDEHSKTQPGSERVRADRACLRRRER